VNAWASPTAFGKVISAHSAISAQAKLMERRELKYDAAERWLFFAEATHTVALYYRDEASSNVRQPREGGEPHTAFGITDLMEQTWRAAPAGTRSEWQWRTMI
jgi:hypothetical protein